VRGALLFLLLALTVPHLLALNPKFTDAELDGFKDVVKSVSTSILRSGGDRDAANHPLIVDPVWCEVCQYDEEGNSVKRGQNLNGRFFGNTTHYVRDENGSIREKILVDGNGQVSQKVMIGPVGKTEELDYRDGVLQDRQTFGYDEHGNLIEWLTFDATGKQTASATAAFDQQGHVTEQFDRGSRNNFLHFTQHFNPDTGVETFTNYNEDGTVRLTYTAKDDQITNYWQQPSDKHEYGSGVCFNTSPKERQCEHHYPDGKVWHQLERFVDEKRHDPIRVELRDETGLLQMAADYEYEFDSRGNWTKRSVWVLRTDPGQRKLQEVDTRSITYWK